VIILLDLNYTLVENSPERGIDPPPMSARLKTEIYRPWLVKLVRSHRVILVTARPARWREATLARIRAQTGWCPQEAYFNDRNLPPPSWKELVLKAHLLTRFDPETMLALESNPKTRAMYERNGIRAVPVGDEPWTRLPV